MDQWTSNKLPERLPFSKKRLPKKVIFSYVADYLIIVVLIGIFSIVDKIEPFHQPFSLQNYTLHYPFAKKERVPVPWLCVYVVGIPAIIIAFYTLVIDGLFSHQTPMPASRAGLKRMSGRYRFKDRLWELNCGILGLGLAVGAAFTVTGALKNAIGKPRPDVIDRCNMKDHWPADWGVANFTLATVAMCNQPSNYILQDGFKSFPSGHSSTAFAGCFYLSLYLAAKLHVMDAKGEVWRAFVVLIPTLGAAVIAGTRIMDARHHPFDVIFGSILGILVAWASYRQYFPPVTETWRKGRAYPIRAWGRGPAPPPAPTPTIMIDEDVQPLRSMAKPDEERGAASGFSSVTAVPGEPEHSGNVFRQQISNSQRRRNEEEPYGVDRSDTLASSNYRTETMDSSYHRSGTLNSTMSSKVNKYQDQMPAPNPFAGDVARQRRAETYDYSSSEDEDSYELQQTYTLSAPQAGVYNPVAGRFTDTGYHAASGISPNPTPPPPLNTGILQQNTMMSPTGDLSERRDGAPPPPPHAVGTMPNRV
ncbi:lipid phosphate phosphatase-like protein 1 [Dothidotthia symphoricarpi CBS 119687]|uniref:Lipid phosphate phosphatase-like protein 1 n=1 Tax=Dothidotthia symphoricarpi CBS 119687 TaxID=1392245 RepID=A0A6A6AJI5_9PLEO|nr:lipid phosphate phosphatase-like protein 1 [Dothidotthia symphoricarpi CBS 119687]KAF2132132.1 lipid phosphate phosphatase-like protein 1 [Dothidotthia symphoricarpi CBS 119687]